MSRQQLGLAQLSAGLGTLSPPVSSVSEDGICGRPSQCCGPMSLLSRTRGTRLEHCPSAGASRRACRWVNLRSVPAEKLWVLSDCSVSHPRRWCHLPWAHSPVTDPLGRGGATLLRFHAQAAWADAKWALDKSASSRRCGATGCAEVPCPSTRAWRQDGQLVGVVPWTPLMPRTLFPSGWVLVSERKPQREHAGPLAVRGHGSDLAGTGFS